MTPVALHHEQTGSADAPVLLMGGSLGTNLAMWDPQLPVLTGRHVIRFDHRGHGRSPAPPGPYSIADLGADVLALIDRLGIERADYCGLSIGGMVGQWLAINAPQRIGRLVLICTSPDTLNPDAFQDRARTVRDAGSTEVVADAVVANWFTQPYADGHPDVIARHRQMIVDTPVEGYAACCEAIAGHNVRARLSQITASTLVIAAAGDRAIPPSQGEAIAAGVPGSKLQILDPAAHIASVERADSVNALIAQHLGGAGAQGGRRGRGGRDPIHEAGMEVRRAVLGDAHVDRAIEHTTEFTAPFQDFITRYAWGSVWTRPGLERRTRSAVTLAVLTALGRENEIAMHVRGALRNGMTPAEIGEVLLHTAIYAGVPAANAAYAIAQRTIDEETQTGGSEDPPAA
ncbi:MAG TPA: 3-oxoadipate enol-lactonase [Solirubrobacteraceae bacterium]|nr:3-oxoadipate enol-lactonase [Solirubrobacteraceae bacterium]